MSDFQKGDRVGIELANGTRVFATVTNVDGAGSLTAKAVDVFRICDVCGRVVPPGVHTRMVLPPWWALWRKPWAEPCPRRMSASGRPE